MAETFFNMPDRILTPYNVARSRRLRPGLHPGPRWGSLQRSPDPVAALGRGEGKGMGGEGRTTGRGSRRVRGGEGREGKGGEGMGREGKGMGPHFWVKFTPLVRRPQIS